MEPEKDEDTLPGAEHNTPYSTPPPIIRIQPPTQLRQSQWQLTTHASNILAPTPRLPPRTPQPGIHDPVSAPVDPELAHEAEEGETAFHSAEVRGAIEEVGGGYVVYYLRFCAVGGA